MRNRSQQDKAVLTVHIGEPKPIELFGDGRTTLDRTDRIRETLEGEAIPMLKLFVYGTLKRGFGNHGGFCRGALEIRDARVRGRLYDGPGFPVLELPDTDILARGTADPQADVATQMRLSGRVEQYPRAVRETAVAGDWDVVYGELLSFDDPESRLPAIDRLEGFRPDGPSLYRRVLVPATVGGVRELVWAYTLEMMHIKHRRIRAGRWPEQRGTSPE